MRVRAKFKLSVVDIVQLRLCFWWFFFASNLINLARYKIGFKNADHILIFWVDLTKPNRNLSSKLFTRFEQAGYKTLIYSAEILHEAWNKFYLGITNPWLTAYLMIKTYSNACMEDKNAVMPTQAVFISNSELYRNA